MLYRSDIGARALTDRALLREVVRHKKVFFDSGYANYDACLAKRFRLVPVDALLAEVKQDYTAMKSSGMFDVPPPSFAEIIDVLKEIERTIND